jgi:hypothetical protein
MHSFAAHPPVELPYLDVGIPGVMAHGEKVRAQAGMFFWRGVEVIGPSDQPTAAAQIIADALFNPPALS